MQENMASNTEQIVGLEGYCDSGDKVIPAYLYLLAFAKHG